MAAPITRDLHRLRLTVVLATSVPCGVHRPCRAIIPVPYRVVLNAKALTVRPLPSCSVLFHFSEFRSNRSRTVGRHHRRLVYRRPAPNSAVFLSKYLEILPD
jgi:hypothetical protein